MKSATRSAVLLLVLFVDYGLACPALIDTAPPTTLDKTGATHLLENWLRTPPAHHAQAIPKPEPTIELVDCYLKGQAITYSKLSNVAPQMKRIANAIVNAGTLTQKSAAIIELNNSVNRDAGTAFLQLPNGPHSTIELDLYEDIVNPSCSESTTENCAEAYTLAANLWWIANYFRSLPDFYNDDDIIDSLAFNQRLNKKWLSYKDDTILLWPQEVLLNSLVFKQEDHGFTEPPAYKLLSLRPSIGLTYLSDQDHKIQPTLNVDLLGIYWWKYAGEDGVMAQPGRGIAASLIWDGSDTALGMTYHHNPKWSVTIAHGNDNDVVLSVSFQLAAWFLNR